MDKLEWTALEYEEKKRSVDWFWALGIIVVTSSVAALIFGNYFFATLLFISGLMLGFFSIKKPDIVSYELNNNGLRIRDRLYPYENIKSFWVQISKNEAHETKPILFINTLRVFMPVMTIQIDSEIADDIRSIMIAKNVLEEEMQEHASQKIMEYLGF